jgi:hypothetical protein
VPFRVSVGDALRMFVLLVRDSSGIVGGGDDDDGMVSRHSFRIR